MFLEVYAVTDDIPDLVRQVSDYIELAEGLGAVLTLARFVHRRPIGLIDYVNGGDFHFPGSGIIRVEKVDTMRRKGGLNACSVKDKAGVGNAA